MPGPADSAFNSAVARLDADLTAIEKEAEKELSKELRRVGNEPAARKMLAVQRDDVGVRSVRTRHLNLQRPVAGLHEAGILQSARTAPAQKQKCRLAPAFFSIRETLLEAEHRADAEHIHVGGSGRIAAGVVESLPFDAHREVSPEVKSSAHSPSVVGRSAAGRKTTTADIGVRIVKPELAEKAQPRHDRERSRSDQ